MLYGQHASGKKFQEILEEAFIRPLKIDGELYIGIPPGNARALILFYFLFSFHESL